MSSEQIRITLPNGDVLQLPSGSTAGDVARSIGPGLAKAAVAAVVDGDTVDLMTPIERDASLRILTEKDPEALAVLRHSAAHVLATAVRTLRPGAGIGFGPAIDDGFYYDFDVEAPFTPEDLEVFEGKMAEVAREDLPFERRRVTKEEAQGAVRGRSAQAGAPGGARRRRGDHGLPRRRVPRPVPGSPRAQHGPDQALQAPLGSRRLLAGRREPSDAAAHLRHGLLQAERAGGAPETAGGGEETRPSPPGPRARPLQHGRARGAGAHPLAPQGRPRAHGDRELRAGPDPAPRLRHRVHAAHHERAAVRDLRPPGELQGEHVRGDGGGRARATARSP